MIFFTISCLFLFGFIAPEKQITIFLAGDSTMAEKRSDKRPETGWGEELQAYFDISEVKIDNHARNGRSTRSFIEEGLWDKIVDLIQPDDYVFIQFGHNDQSKKKVKRYTAPDQYRKNLLRFISDVRIKKGNPVLLTSVVRRRFNKEGQFYDVHGVYPDLVRSAAKEAGVPLVDMHRLSEQLLEESGEEDSKLLFLWLQPGEYENYPDGLTDNTHFSPTGAKMMASLAIKNLLLLDLDLPIIEISNKNQ